MPGPAAPRRALAALRPAPGAVALTLYLGALAVLLCVGVWASRLGNPPSWAFDCDDTTCTDLWIEARRHYLAVAAGAGVAAVIGWFLGGFAVPSRPVPAPHGRRSPAFLRLLGMMLLTGALLVGSGWLMVAMSRPMGLAGAAIAIAVAAGGAWRWMRPGAASDRTAYWTAGAGAAIPLLVLGLLCLHPMGFVAMVLVVGLPLLGIPALCVLLLAGTVVAGRLLPRRTAEQGSAPGSAAGTAAEVSAPGGAVGATEQGPTPGSAAGRAGARSDAGRLVTAFAVAALLALGVRAAWPVEAPAADAWTTVARPEDPAGPDAGRADAEAGTDGPGATEGPDEPSDSGGAADGRSTPGGHAADADDGPSAGPVPDPLPDASDLPDCAADDLVISAGGWDWWTGNSAAALTATNDGEEVCAVRGTPELTLTQGGEEIALRPEPLTHLEAAEQPDGGIGLRPGDSARSLLYWPGYRTAADLETPQALTLRLAPGGAPAEVDLSGEASGGPESAGVDDDAAGPVPQDIHPGPAPFDLVAGVPGGAVIEIGPWESVPTPAL